MKLSTQGRIVRIFPTVTRKSSRTGSVLLTRKFWIEAQGDDFGSSRKTQIVEFNIMTTGEPNPNYAMTDDLDRISVGKVVRFNFQIASVISINRANGDERCFTNLTVCSRIDVIGSSSPYSKAKMKDIRRKKEEHERISEAAMNDYAENAANGNAVPPYYEEITKAATPPKSDGR